MSKNIYRHFTDKDKQMAEKHMRGTGVTYTAAVETACDSHKTEHTPTTQASLHTPWRSPK